jgi:hypothetical protein
LSAVLGLGAARCRDALLLFDVKDRSTYGLGYGKRGTSLCNYYPQPVND